MKAQIFHGPTRLEGILFHADGTWACSTWTRTDGTHTVQTIMETLESVAAAAEAGPVCFEFFVDPRGTHEKELKAFELRLAWDAIRRLDSFPDEFIQAQGNPTLGRCNHAISEVGPTLKTINQALAQDNRQVRAVVSPTGTNIFSLEWKS